jgi:hypothetical protein
MTIWNILWPLGVIYGHLVYFVVTWYILHILVCFDQEKSGNPAHILSQSLAFEI